jgi:hypothetical protein
MRVVPSALLALFLSGAASAHAANSTVFSDLASWEANAGSPILLQDFSGYRNEDPLKKIPEDVLAVVGLPQRYFLPGVLVDSNMRKVEVFLSFAEFVEGDKKMFGNPRDELSELPYYDILYEIPYGAVAFEIDAFENLATAVSGTSQNATLEIFFADASSRSVSIAPNDGSAIFFGIVSDTPISRIRWTEVLEDNSEFAEETALDNFRVGATVPIPEPSTWALLLAGLGLVGLTAKRRQR